MWYVIVFMVGFGLAILIMNWEDIKCSHNKKRKIKRYNKLFNGSPKTTVQLHSWADVFKYRHYPFLLNDEVVGVKGNLFLWWHINDEYKRLHNINGDFIGYLKSTIIRSRRCYSGWFHYWSLSLAQKPSETGKTVKLSAVIEVH